MIERHPDNISRERNHELPPQPQFYADLKRHYDAWCKQREKHSTPDNEYFSGFIDFGDPRLNLPLQTADQLEMRFIAQDPEDEPEIFTLSVMLYKDGQPHDLPKDEILWDLEDYQGYVGDYWIHVGPELPPLLVNAEFEEKIYDSLLIKRTQQYGQDIVGTLPKKDIIKEINRRQAGIELSDQDCVNLSKVLPELKPTYEEFYTP